MINRCAHIHGIAQFQWSGGFIRWWICPMTKCWNFGFKYEFV